VLCVCMCVCVCMHVCVCVSMCGVYMCVCMCDIVCGCMYMCVGICIYVCGCHMLPHMSPSLMKLVLSYKQWGHPLSHCVQTPPDLHLRPHTAEPIHQRSVTIAQVCSQVCSPPRHQRRKDAITWCAFNCSQWTLRYRLCTCTVNSVLLGSSRWIWQ